METEYEGAAPSWQRRTPDPCDLRLREATALREMLFHDAFGRSEA
jgi:hypothetical protein